jgi:hypothetical protein
MSCVGQRQIRTTTVDTLVRRDTIEIGSIDTDPDLTPPSRNPIQPPVYVSHPQETSRHKPSSQVSRPETYHRRTEITAPIIAEQVLTEPLVEGAIKFAQLKKNFTDICFDGYIFPPHLKNIPAEANNTMHD